MCTVSSGLPPVAHTHPCRQAYNKTDFEKENATIVSNKFRVEQFFFAIRMKNGAKSTILEQ
jgi:hypothetical protein